MEKLKLNVHPLFFVFGFLYAITGKIFVFIVYTLTAVMHEIGHSLVAESKGYRLNSITLMPFGAVVSGNTDMREKDQLKVALAGPFLNLSVGLLFVAFWWIFPQLYAYTDIVVEANFSLALVNLIPAYPLDGGRALFAFLSLRLNKVKAEKICKGLGLVLCVLLLGLFIFSLFFTPNFSLLLFSSFVFFGVISRDRSNVYVKMRSAYLSESLKRGVPIQKFAVDKSVTLKKIMQTLDKDTLNEVVVYDGEVAVACLSQKRVNELVEKNDIYEKIGNLV